ncbi:MAG: response regulator transcription factor [Acidobacteriaceae bacterium]|nr:response regulator transcription factor [Acidobacteriaceae bacterium]
MATQTNAFNGVNQRLPTPSMLLADELALVREGLASLCKANVHCNIVGQCADGATALRMIREMTPDLAFLDLNLPELFTLEVIRQVKNAGLPTKIAVLSTRSDRKTVLEALRSGASGFLLKSGPLEQIEQAVHDMMVGKVYLSPLLNAEDIFAAEDKIPADSFDTLSPREFQVFTMLVEGVRAKEIAARLGLSPKTVDTYRSSLMQKLEIFDVAGLVKFAIQRSLISTKR